MAKGISPYLSEIRGTVSKKLTFRHLKTKAGQVLQQIPIPSYRRTDKQDAVRTGYRRLCDLWKTADWLDKSVYEYFADIYRLTTFNTWLKFNLPVMTKRPALYLGMDEGSGTVAHDYSVHENDGTIEGASWQKLPNGKNVLYFDGVDDEVSAGDKPEFNTQTFTMLIWVKLLQKPSTYSVKIMGKQDQYWFEWRATRKLSLSIKDVSGAYDGGGPIIYLDDGEWHLIGFIYDGETKYGGHNGEYVFEKYIGFEIPTTTNPMTISSSVQFDTTYSSGFIGYATMAMFTQKVLTEKEFKQIYMITKPLFK